MICFVATSPKTKEQIKKGGMRKKNSDEGERGNTSQVSYQVVCCLFIHMDNLLFCCFVLLFFVGRRK